MRRYLDPRWLRETAGKARRVHEGGGPASVRLDGIGRPRGWLAPTTTISLDVVARDGERTRFEPELFVPLPAAIGERFAHWLIERCRSRPEA